MYICCVEILLKIIPMLKIGKYEWVGVHMLWNSYAACIPLRINSRLFPISVLHMFMGSSYQSAWQQNKPHRACWPPNPRAQRCPLPSAVRCSCIHAGIDSSAAALTALEMAGCHGYQIDPMSHQAPGNWKIREKILIKSNTNQLWQTRLNKPYCCYKAMIIFTLQTLTFVDC